MPKILILKGKVLTSNNAVINVMVNPVDISLEEYTFTLQNSKGTNTYLDLENLYRM